MKKYIILFFVFIVGFTVNDIRKEFITIDWKKMTEEPVVGQDGISSFLVNANFPETAELPVYSRLYDLKDDTRIYRFVIEDPVFEATGFKAGARFDSLKEDLEINTHLLKSGNTRKLELQLIPLKIENGTVYRLKSFRLRMIEDFAPKSTAKGYQWKSSSVLKSGKWIKISTPGKGIYKIPYSTLNEWGFADPGQVQVFGSGGIILPEDPGNIIYDDLPQSAVWRGLNGGENCLFFYAPGSVAWSPKPGSDVFRHRLNDYTDKGYFFLTENAGQQKDVELLVEITGEATHTVTSFNEYALIEEEKVNILPGGSGKRWFGEKYGNGTSRDHRFTIVDIEEDTEAKLTVSAVARSYQPSKLTVSSPGAGAGEIGFNKVETSDSYGLFADEKAITFSEKFSNGPLDLTLTYQAANSSAEAWLDYMELNYRRKLKATENLMFFRDIASVGNENIAEFVIENAKQEHRVFDVTDLNNVKEVPVQFSGNTISFKRSSNELREYVVFDPAGSFPVPGLVGEVENQDLHSLGTPEFLIITHPNFMGSAEELANFHRNYDGMSVEVVSADAVYNEFSSGSKSATGIRNFIKMFYDRGSALKYVLLFGDGSYDNKNIRPDSKNFIPTFQSDNSLVPTSSFVTDDYYVMLDDGESVYNGAIDLGIGRIPASTAYEAELVVDKIYRYHTPEALGNWRNVLCFLGDDGDNNVHMKQSEMLADYVNDNYREFVTDKIYFDAYPEEVTSAGERYPDVNEAIANRVKEGVLVLNYVGHANERFLAHENVLGISEINSWSNVNKLPIFVTATCEFSRFDADETSAGEYVLMNPSGGGIGLFSTTRVVYSSPNFALSQSFYKYIFAKDANGDHYRMGDVMRLAKTNTHGNVNKRNFSLLSDPALKLSYPEYKVVTSSINGQAATEVSDTVGALQKITVSGYVSDFLDNKLDDFNGEIVPVVYDKEVGLETLGNGGQKPMSFKVRENIIYKGRASVTNGEFSFSFVIPKDISYNLGKGKIVYYTDNGETDANGAFENFIIGGSGSEITDNRGPEIQLYMDSPDFVPGGKTSKNPTMLAFLSDENGINTVGTGIGHDITAVLDDDYSNVVVLNSYYQADKDDYTSGSVKYLFKDLAVGKHTLRLKAWDVANNSTEVEIEFEVSGDFIINGLSNYPNPVSSHTYFVFEHNQSDATLNAIFDIFDQSGRRVDQFRTEVGSNGLSSNPVRWDLTESEMAITPGVYIYRVIVQNSDGVIASKSGKMVVAR